MAFDEEAGYAAVVWQRFDSSVSDELLRALISAFALVAVADGDLAGSEADRFVALIRDHAEVLPAVDLVRVEESFRDIGAALLSDPSAGRTRALSYVAAVKGNAHRCELVHSAAEIALAADSRTLQSELEALRQICSVLGVDARQ